MTDDIEALLQADPAELTYEQARDGLSRVVTELESGSASLEESLALWEKGEALARRCNEWLDDAQRRLDEATGPKPEPQTSSAPALDTAAPPAEEPPW